jgi:hypothetical protein
MSALSELLTQANKEGLSLQKITDRMRERGHDIGKDTVWKYMTGRHTVVTTAYLRAFVDVFPSLSLAALQRAADMPRDLGQWEPPDEAHALDQREREALEVLIRSMARGKTSAVQPVATGNERLRAAIEQLSGQPEAHQVAEAAMEEKRGRRRTPPGESEEPYTER